MTRRVRLVVFGVAVVPAAVMLLFAFAGAPQFGTARHPYGTRAVAAALRHHTANAVSSVNFDQRGLDTLGEELILFASALGAAVLLRRLHDEEEAAGTTHR